MKFLKTTKVALMLVAVTALSSAGVYAANNSTMNQMINAGVLTTDILDATRTPVASPSVALSARPFSFDCQFGGNASTGTFGTNTERIYVSNPNAVTTGTWTLGIAATGGATSTWSDGGTNTYDFNDAGTSGCTDGADTDTKAGQLSMDPAAGTVNLDCSVCTQTGISKGSAASFVEGSVNSLTLLTGAGGSDDVWRGYLTAAGISQTIPGETPAANYSLNLTLTATSI